jgi:hypothetical protein
VPLRVPNKHAQRHVLHGKPVRAPCSVSEYLPKWASAEPKGITLASLRSRGSLAIYCRRMAAPVARRSTLQSPRPLERSANFDANLGARKRGSGEGSGLPLTMLRSSSRIRPCGRSRP